MNKFKIKKIILPFFLISILFIIIYVSTYFVIKNEYKDIINGQTQAYISVIKNIYPNVPEDEIIKIIQNPNNNTEGKEILKKYGYDETGIYSQEVNNFLNKMFCLYLGVIILLALSLMRLLLNLR